MTVIPKKKIKILEERKTDLIKLEKNNKKRFLMIFKDESNVHGLCKILQ